MKSGNQSSAARSLAVLHPVFLLTGLFHAIGGPLLPSLASTFNLDDSQSGLLLSLYFAGSSLGALLCVGRYTRAMAVGFALVAMCCLGVATNSWPFLLLLFLALGVGVGLPMSAVSLFVGQAFPNRSAPLLVFLNFSWSLGALVAPLLAALVLASHGFRTAYGLLAGIAVIAALACAVLLSDEPEVSDPRRQLKKHVNLRAITLFALAAFLEVGIENTAAAWLSTYALRTTSRGAAFAATLSALYWTGFLLSRAGASLALLRFKAVILLRIAIPLALVAATLLFVSRVQWASSAAMFLLGMMLAPIYPLIVAESFGRVRQTSDSRWILAAAGFGGSVLPWLTGWISAQTGSIRAALLTLPAALLTMIFLLPFLFSRSAPPSSQSQA